MRPTPGADLTQLKRWAGHESVTTLIDTYGHLMPDREGPVLAALEALARPSRPPETATSQTL